MSHGAHHHSAAQHADWRADGDTRTDTEIEVWYAQTYHDQVLRLHGDGKNRIQNRHVIGKMVRKLEALLIVATVQIFSHHPFRTAFDSLKRTRMVPIQADKVYLKEL